MAQHMQEPEVRWDGATEMREEGGSGWLAFAAVMFMAAAGLNAIYGVAALVNDDYFAVDELLLGDLSLWGVVFLCFAAACLLAGVLIMFRNAIGVTLGICLAVLHALVVLLSIGAYPLWSVVLLFIDGLIIYGLCVHGYTDA